MSGLASDDRSTTGFEEATAEASVHVGRWGGSERLSFAAGCQLRDEANCFMVAPPEPDGGASPLRSAPAALEEGQARQRVGPRRRAEKEDR